MKATYRSTNSAITNPITNQFPKYQSKAGDPELQRSFRGHKTTVTSVVFASNMKHCLSASEDGMIKAWSFKPQSRPNEFMGHKAAIHQILYHPSGKYVASASSDETVKLWANITGSCNQYELPVSHSAPIRTVDFSTDGGLMLSGSHDKTIKTWKLKQKKIKGHDRLIASFNSSILGHTNWINSAQFSPDARIIVSGSDDKTVKIWDLVKKKELLSFTDHLSSVSDVKFHPDGTCVASGSIDTKVKLWDLRSKRLLQHYDAHDEAVNKISFHPNGKYLISASDDSSIKIWDVRMGNILFTLYGHDGPVTAISFSQCGDYFVTGGEDTIVNVWKFHGDNSDVTGTINVGGLKDTSFKSNVDTYMVNAQSNFERGKSASRISPSKARLNTQGSAASNIGPVYLKSETSRADLMSTKKLPFDDMHRSPEEEFYKQPAKIETIPDAALSKGSLENVPHEVSSTISKIVNQLDMLSNMLQLLDQRVSSNESSAREALSFFKELNHREVRAQQFINHDDDFHEPQTPE